jgi:hypothetical protein
VARTASATSTTPARMAGAALVIEQDLRERAAGRVPERLDRVTQKPWIRTIGVSLSVVIAQT